MTRFIRLLRPLAVAAAICGAVALMPVAAGPPQAGVTVLKNFTLIDGTERAPVAAAAMIIDSGRISWIGPVAQLKTPTAAESVDLSGKFVMPGLIDLHVHLGNTVDLTQDKKFYSRESVEKNLRTYAAYGVTTVLSMGTDSDPIFAIRQEQRSGRSSMTRIFTAGQGLVFKGGYGGLAGVNEPVETVADADRSVAAQAAKKVDVIKFWLDDELGAMPKMPPAVSKAIIDAAHRRNLRVLAHVFYLEDAKRLAEQGVDGFVHSVRDQPVDATLVNAMKTRGTWQVAETLSREASMFAYGATPPFASDSFFTRGISETALQLIRSPERQQTAASGPHFKEYPAFLATAKKNTKALVDAGVKYGFGTDTGPPGRFAGYFDHWELQLMVEAGLTPQQVLAAATRRSAEFLGAKDLGTLEKSKWADLIVLDANPLADIKNTRTIRAVYIAGQRVPVITQ
jgi:imidazolonepropionase-like amidohydrolase